MILKTKQNKLKNVKKFDKAIAWKERIKDRIVYASKKIKDGTDDKVDPVDYGEDKIKYTSNRLADESIYLEKKTYSKTKSIVNNKISNSPSYGKLKKKMQSRKNAVKNKIMSNTKKKAKNTWNTSKKAIKGMISTTKTLIAALIAGGTVSLVIIAVVGVVALLFASVFGIFFSSEKVSSYRMSDYIVELNSEMNKKIDNIKRSTPHDEVIINSNKADWKDVLSIYTVKVLKDNPDANIMILDDNKKETLNEVFWDMNKISYRVKTEEIEKDTIGTWDNNEIPTPLESEINKEKKILYINIDSKSIKEMGVLYDFNSDENRQIEELSSSKYLPQWNSVIYGVYEYSGEYKEWKQYDNTWSNIEVGSSGKTLGKIGCIITSISMLIKKSGVETNNITPFNPAIFLIALNNNYGFDSSGNIRYSAISKVVPDFIYQGHVSLKDKSKSEKLYEISKYMEKGYYLTIEVKGATKNSQHWVALDNIDGNTISMFDPASNSTNMWAKYDWNKTSQFVYFKLNK